MKENVKKIQAAQMRFLTRVKAWRRRRKLIWNEDIHEELYINKVSDSIKKCNENFKTTFEENEQQINRAEVMLGARGKGGAEIREMEQEESSNSDYILLFVFIELKKYIFLWSQ